MRNILVIEQDCVYVFVSVSPTQKQLCRARCCFLSSVKRHLKVQSANTVWLMLLLLLFFFCYICYYHYYLSKDVICRVVSLSFSYTRYTERKNYYWYKNEKRKGEKRTEKKRRRDELQRKERRTVEKLWNEQWGETRRQNVTRKWMEKRDIEEGRDERIDKERRKE